MTQVQALSRQEVGRQPAIRKMSDQQAGNQEEAATKVRATPTNVDFTTQHIIRTT